MIPFGRAVFVLSTAVMAAILVFVLPVNASTGGATPSKRSCKNMKEDKGCKLPSKAFYTNPEAGWSFSITRQSVTGDDEFPAALRASIPSSACPGGDPRSQVTYVGFQSGKFKVGKTYTATRKDTQEFINNTRHEVTATIKFNSARKASARVKGTILIGGGSILQCNFDVKETINRKKLQ